MKRSPRTKKRVPTQFETGFASVEAIGCATSAAAKVGPDGRDGGRDGIGAAASEGGDTGKAVRKCIELAVVYGDTGRA